ncbi:hypothetical protein EYR36_000816 [Pleurotus pulmonarius]|nr:hypothetical protein EYR36_004562 [Pleurotus pulmonarius]KAF4579007.1 hypothetical protein EYR36_000816 [Pleurotus pulmonarius]
MPFVQCGVPPLALEADAPDATPTANLFILTIQSGPKRQNVEYKRPPGALKELESRGGSFHQMPTPRSPPRRPRGAPVSPRAMRSTRDNQSSGFDTSSWGKPSSGSNSIPQATATLRNFTGGWKDLASTSDPVGDSGSNDWGAGGSWGSGGGWGSPKAVASGSDSPKAAASTWGSWGSTSGGWGSAAPSWGSSTTSGQGSWGGATNATDTKETSTSSWARASDASPTRWADTAKEPDRPQQTHTLASSSRSDMNLQPSSRSHRLDRIDTNLPADVHLSRRDSRSSPTTSIRSSVDKKTADPLRPLRPLPHKASSRQSSVSRTESSSRRIVPDLSLTSQLDEAEVSKLMSGPTTELTSMIIKLMIEAVHLKIQVDKAQRAYNELRRTLESRQYERVNNAGRTKFNNMLQTYSDSLHRQKQLLAGTVRNLSRLPDLARLGDTDSAVEESALLTYAGDLKGWMEQTKTYVLALKRSMITQTQEIQGPIHAPKADPPLDEEVAAPTTPTTELLRSTDAAESKFEDLLTGFYSVDIKSLAVTEHLDTMISSKIAEDTRGARLQELMDSAAQMETEFNKVTDVAADLFTKQGDQKVQLRLMEGDVLVVQQKRLNNAERTTQVEQTDVEHAQLLDGLMDKVRNLHIVETNPAPAPESQLPLTKEQMEECVDIIVDRFMDDLRPTLADTEASHLRQIHNSASSITNTIWPRLEPFAKAVRSLAIKVSPVNNPQESFAAE